MTSDVTPQEFRNSFYKQGVWHRDTFTLAAVVMFESQPAFCLHGHTQTDITRYQEFVRIACEYGDAMDDLLIKSKLKAIVWIDIKKFYDTLANLVCMGKKTLPFDENDIKLFAAVAEIWTEVGIFHDYPQTEKTAFAAA